ncbi:MAG TPA: DUF1566 domain-containing protein [Thioploca sp.]|nr:MAG: hypothetical protein DRR19_10305 [Gammaproteobacteria bacterium]HDN26534.1 DUF1566 domain-containing protein [Thioploca sp.]
MECYEKAMGKLQQALNIVETQRIENEQLQRKVAQMEKQIAELQIRVNRVYRYLDNGDGTVTDNRTGLIWLKNANCFGRQHWRKAMQSAANLAHGQCGLRDGSSRGTWRLPTIDEWKAMIDTKYVDRENYSQPALSNAAGNGPWTEGDVFSGVQTDNYWSSTTNKFSSALDVDLNDGSVVFRKSFTCHVWPVRRRYSHPLDIPYHSPGEL